MAKQYIPENNTRLVDFGRRSYLAGEQDALVLVATITSLPKGYVAFEHEVGSSTAAAAAALAASTTSSEEDTHIEGPPSPDVRLHLSDRSIASSSPVVSKRQVDEDCL